MHEERLSHRDQCYWSQPYDMDSLSSDCEREAGSWKLEDGAQTLCNNVDILSHVERIRRERVFLTKHPSSYEFCTRDFVVC